jgi:hypothetical protein
MIKAGQLIRAVGAITIASFMSPLGASDAPWCSINHRDPAVASAIATSDIFLVDENKLETAIARLEARRMAALTDREAAGYVSAWVAVPGYHIYLVRAGIATAGAGWSDQIYDIAKDIEFFGFLHTDGQLEIVTPQMGGSSPIFEKLPLIVRTRHPASSESAVCHYLAEDFRPYSG